MFFSTSPSGWITRSVSERVRSAYPRRTWRPSTTARCRSSRWGGRGAVEPPQPAGSSTTAEAAASASARNVSGSAWTSLRSAALASGVAVDDGPATMNRVRASAAVSPLRSVRAPPISDQPPPLPACE